MSKTASPERPSCCTGKSMIVIFEGSDRTGKDVLRQTFEKRNSYANTCITRLFFSQFVYAYYYKRPLWTNHALRLDYIDTIRKFVYQFEPLVVFTTASQEVINERITRCGEDVNAHGSIEVINALYRKMFKLAKLPDRLLLVIDTTNNPSLNTLADIVQSRVNNLEEQNGKH